MQANALINCHPVSGAAAAESRRVEQGTSLHDDREHPTFPIHALPFGPMLTDATMTRCFDMLCWCLEHQGTVSPVLLRTIECALCMPSRWL